MPNLLKAKHNDSFAREYAGSAEPEALFVRYFGLDLFEAEDIPWTPVVTRRRRRKAGWATWLRRIFFGVV